MVVNNTVEDIMKNANYEMGLKGSGADVNVDADVDADALYNSALEKGEIVLPDLPLPSYMAYSRADSSPGGDDDCNTRSYPRSKLSSIKVPAIPANLKQPDVDVKSENHSDNKWLENEKTSKNKEDIKRGFTTNIVVGIENDENSAEPMRDLANSSCTKDPSGNKNITSPTKSKTNKTRNQIPDNENSRVSKSTGIATYVSDSSSGEWVLTSDSEDGESSNDDGSIDSQKLQKLVEDTIEGESDMDTLRRVIFGCNDSNRFAELVLAKAKVQAEVARRNRQEKKKMRTEQKQMRKRERIKKRNKKRERRLIREQSVIAVSEGSEMEKLRLKAKIIRDEKEKQRRLKAETERIKKKNEKRERRLIREQNDIAKPEGTKMEQLRSKGKIVRDENEEQRKLTAETERIKKLNEKRLRKLIKEQNIVAIAEGTEMKKLRLKAQIKRDEDEKQRKAEAEKKEMQAKVDAISSWW